LNADLSGPLGQALRSRGKIRQQGEGPSVDSASNLRGLSTPVALHYESAFCLSFATLTAFLDQHYTFDFTLAQTRLRLRRTGADGQSFWSDCEWGWQDERQRTKQTNTGANAKQEANRDNEAKSAQTKSHQTIKIANSWPCPGWTERAL